MVGILISAGTAFSQTTWTRRSPSTAKILNGISHGAGLYVAVGDEGAIVSSPNAITWTARSSGTTEDLRAIKYAAGIFVATGSNGALLTSPDGITWTSRATGTTKFLSGIAHGAGRFVAVGGTGTTVTSTNGTDWTTHASITNNFLQAVTYANGKFVAVGALGTGFHSADGLVWTSIPAPPTNDFLMSVIYFAGKYYTVGQNGRVLSSANLSAWTYGNTGTFSWLRALATDGGGMIAVGDDGTIISTTDGSTWTARTSGTSVALYGATYANGLYVAVGDLVSNNGVILTSPPDLSPPSPYTLWKQANFTTEQQADPAISGPYADFEPDSLKNVVEFFHGLNPKAQDASSTRLPTPEYPDDNGHASLKWVQEQDAAEEVTIVVRYSQSLLANEWQILNVAPSLLSSEGTLDTMVVVDSSPDATRRFYRLEYTLND